MSKREFKKLTREQVMSVLTEKYPELHVDTTEAFFGHGQNNGGIWLCGEGSDEHKDGKQLFSHYSYSNSGYSFGVHTKLYKWATARGWSFEWNDPGTIMMWEN